MNDSRARVLEPDPAVRDLDEAGAVLGHLQRVRATQIDRHRGRRVDEEELRRSPDARVNRALRERHAMLARARFDQLQARVGIDVHAADLPDRRPAPVTPRRSRATCPRRARPADASARPSTSGAPSIRSTAHPTRRCPMRHPARARDEAEDGGSGQRRDRRSGRSIARAARARPRAAEAPAIGGVRRSVPSACSSRTISGSGSPGAVPQVVGVPFGLHACSFSRSSFMPR